MGKISDGNARKIHAEVGEMHFAMIKFDKNVRGFMFKNVEKAELEESAKEVFKKIKQIYRTLNSDYIGMEVYGDPCNFTLLLKMQCKLQLALFYTNKAITLETDSKEYRIDMIGELCELLGMVSMLSDRFGLDVSECAPESNMSSIECEINKLRCGYSEDEIYEALEQMK